MSEPEPYLAVSDIVEKYGVSRRTVQRWITGKLIHPAQTLKGRTGAHLFTKEEVDRAFGGRRPASDAVEVDDSVKP